MKEKSWRKKKHFLQIEFFVRGHVIYIKVIKNTTYNAKTLTLKYVPKVPKTIESFKVYNEIFLIELKLQMISAIYGHSELRKQLHCLKKEQPCEVSE